jgi:tryptophan-rich sensory protein
METDPTATKPPRDRITRHILKLVATLGATFLVAAIASQFMPGEWYQQLTKPAWTPPNWVFGPVWTILYAAMAVAAWLVWRNRSIAEVSRPLALFAVQLVLNGLWSYLFFGRQMIGMAFIDIMALWLLIILTTVVFWRYNRYAGILFVPYVLWVTYAATLNFQLMRLN